MPNSKRRKSVAYKKVEGSPSSSKVSNQSSTFRWGESYTSLLLGIIVVIIGILFVVSLARTQHIKQVTSIATNIISPTLVPLHISNTPTPALPTATPTALTTKAVPTKTIMQPTTAPTAQQTVQQKNGQRVYTVHPGDDLWHISEKYYNSGYNYMDIARANNLDNPSMLFTGMKLIIPQTQQITPEPQTTTPTVTQVIAQQPIQSGESTIQSSTYTIQKGDNLWSIAVRAYNNGYKWTDIAQANSLTNPDLIHSGNILKIPR